MLAHLPLCAARSLCWPVSGAMSERRFPAGGSRAVGPRSPSPGCPGLPGAAVLGHAAWARLSLLRRGTGLLGRADAREGLAVGRTGGAGLQAHRAPAQLEHFGQVVEVRIVRAGLKQQRRAVGVLGQPQRHDSPRSHTVDNDVIVFHGNRSLRGLDGGIVHGGTGWLDSSIKHLNLLR